MLNRAHILILEDDIGWIDTLSDILLPQGSHLKAATSLATAIDLLQHNYFNVAIVDISLETDNDTDSQGMKLLEFLRDSGLNKAISTIMLSANGNVARVNVAYRDFQVVDFLDKGEFNKDALTNSIVQALTKNNLYRVPEIEISKRRQISDLWKQFNWPNREEEKELIHEFTDLLLRLFPDAIHLFIDDIPTGQSGAGVLRILPAYELAVGAPVIVKFGKRDKIEIERTSYFEHIEHFTGSQSSTQLTAASGRAMAAIAYSFVGTDLDSVQSFADFYMKYDVRKIKQALDNLFRTTCRRWYDGREQLRKARNLVELYQVGLNINWHEVWEKAGTHGLDLAQQRLEFPGIAGAYQNPRTWLEEKQYEINMQVWRSITHGDLNQNNILVTDDARCWLIDFYRTGMGHILRDAIELESAVKFGISSFTSLQEFMQFEKLLLQQNRLNEPIAVEPDHPFYKPLTVIGYIRSIADTFAGGGQSMQEYEIGLLLTTLNLVTVKFYDPHRQKVMLSATMLCEKLSNTP